jgi:hypothetical protein
MANSEDECMVLPLMLRVSKYSDYMWYIDFLKCLYLFLIRFFFVKTSYQ